jgi:hypothetical protein
MPSSIPFEQRYVPPDPRRRKREPMTAADRLVCAICGGLLGLVIWSFFYWILLMGAMKASAKANIRDPAAAPAVDPFAMLPSFAWGGLVAACFGIYGTVVGAERMLDRFEKVIRIEGEVAKHVNRS